MKHTIKQEHTDLLGQYNTENVDDILENFAYLIKGRNVVDPFAGKWHLLDWADRNGAASISGQDIEVLDERTEYNDSFESPRMVDAETLIVTNPPYLSKNRNKNGDRRPYDWYTQDDYYKCYLASLLQSNVHEAIIIQPTNFLCEARAKARETLFRDYHIVSAEYWTESCFDGVEISVSVLHIKKGHKPSQNFVMTQRPSGKLIELEMRPENKYIAGNEFFDYIRGHDIKAEKVDVGMDPPNTNIVVSLLDKGKYGLGLYYNEADPIYCNPSSFTTYQINLPITITEDIQREIVIDFNDKMKYFRDKYDSFFLGFYIDAKQKILSRKYTAQLLAKIISEKVA